MKNAIRFLSLMLAIAMVFSVFAGCSKETEVDLTDEIETLESTVTSAGGELGDIGKGGIKTQTTITGNEWGSNQNAEDRGLTEEEVLNYKINGNIILYGFTKPDASKSNTEAAQTKMYETLEKNMNCKIKFVSSTVANTNQQTILNVMSATHFADLITTPQHAIVGYLTSDLLHDMNKIKTVDLTEPYMNVGNGVNAFNLGSGFWAVNDPHYLAIIGNYVYYNKRIMKEVTGNADYPYELMKKDKWNISEFRNLNKKATKELNGDGKMTEFDQWGLLMDDPGTAGFSAVLAANGAQMIKNVNGMLTYNMEDGKCIPAINLGVDLFYKDNACLPVTGEKTFVAGRGLFYGGAFAAHCPLLADMKDDFGVLPFPKGDNQKNYSVAANWNTMTFAIPASVPKDKRANTGAFLQALMLLEQDVVEAQFAEYTLRYCRDEQSKENLMVGYRAQVTTYDNTVANDDSIKMGTFRVCYEANKKSPATTIAENKGISIKALADLNEKLK